MRKQLVKIAAFAATFTMTISSVPINALAATPIKDVLPTTGIGYAIGTNVKALSEIFQESESAQAAQTAQTEQEETVTDLSLTDMGTDSSVFVTDTDYAETASVVDAGAITTGTLTTDETTTTEARTGSGKVIQDTVIVSKGYTDDLRAASGAQDDEEEAFKNLVIAQVTNYVNVRDLPSEEGEIVGKLYNNSVGNFIEEENGWYKISSGSVEGYVKGEFCVTGVEAVELARQVGTRLATVTTTTLYVRE